MGVGEGESERKVSGVSDTSPPPSPAEYGSRTQPAAPRSKVGQQCQEEMIEKAEKMKMSDQDMDQKTTELSRAPGVAVNETRAGVQTTSKDPQ